MKSFRNPALMTTQERFATLPAANINRSTFDRSHGYKTTFDAGQLIPVFWDEVLPGDTFHLNSTGICRLATPLKPFMDNVFLDTHFFYVPYRQVWEEFQQFMGERKTPDDDPDLYSPPRVFFQCADPGRDGTLWDYFGLPKREAGGQPQVSALPFRAYNLIWNEWYRDENLQDPVQVDIGSSTDPFNVTTMRPLPRNKRKDYFTSALPWPQKGDEVVIPLGQVAYVKGLGIQTGTPAVGGGGTNIHESGASAPVDYGLMYATADSTYSPMIKEDPNNPGYPLVWADLSTATAVSINDLRTAFQIQKLLERDARGGTRYIEIILTHFGVQSDDLRLQRPEYLGGGTSRINVNPIASTFAAGDVVQGELAGVGTSVPGGGFSKSFSEHGIVIGLISARADLTYQNGIERMWTRRTRYDYYWPVFQGLGEQAIYNYELYYAGTSVDSQVFGYQERYAEYRYKPSRITGLFASNSVAPLDMWHLSEDFSATPLLNDDFVRENPPIDRVIAVPGEPHFLLDMWFKFKCVRPMPARVAPGFIDHF